MKILGFLLSWLILFSFHVHAQNVYSTKKQIRKKENTIKFLERWSIRTNTVDWVTTVPNMAIEFDVSDSVYNRWSVGLSLKYNYIPKSTDFSSRLTYKIGDVRLEARRYFRSYQIFPYRSRARKNRGWWRAYYVGPYLSLTRYAFHVSAPAYEGRAFSLGVTGGYNIPLYETRKGGAIDLDLGLSLGAVYVDHEKLQTQQWNSEARVLPYPMLTDLRVGLVYRWRSVRKKYVALNEEKILQRQTEYLMKEKLRIERKYQDSLRQDSIQKVKNNIRIKKHKQKK